jgi:hypothetical protein
LAATALNSPFLSVRAVPGLLNFLKCILEVVVRDRVQRFCRNHLIYVKMAAFQFHLQSEKQKKLDWLGDDSHYDFGKIILWQ